MLGAAAQLVRLDRQLALSSSAWTRIELYSPAAIEIAPDTSPARPASRTTAGAGSAPATPRISPMLDTSPSLTPNTAARADAALDVAVVVLGVGPSGTWGITLGDGTIDRRRGRYA